MKISNKPLYIVVLISLIANIVFLFLLLPKPASNTKQSDYPFLSKRLFIEDSNDIIINFVPLRSSLRDYVAKAKDPLAFYFEYLPSGTSIGVNEKEPFFAASLLKIPVVMRIYKLIEEGKINQDTQLTIEEKHIDKGFGTLWQKGVGAKISVKEAIKLSVSQSDNTADKLLRELTKKKPVSDVFDYLDIPTDLEQNGGAGVTTKGFSSVLRGLYLSAYISYEHSNEILETMTKSPYTDRLVAGVSSDVKVAHKVAVYKNPQDPQVQIHSDCGVVYAPHRPYILCVMTKANINEATKQISEISKMVFSYVNSVNR